MSYTQGIKAYQQGSVIQMLKDGASVAEVAAAFEASEACVQSYADTLDAPVDVTPEPEPAPEEAPADEGRRRRQRS